MLYKGCHVYHIIHEVKLHEGVCFYVISKCILHEVKEGDSEDCEIYGRMEFGRNFGRILDEGTRIQRDGSVLL